MSLGRIATVPGAAMFVELGIGDTRTVGAYAGVWDTDRWDTAPGAVWAGTDPYWLDVSCSVIGVDDYRGHDRVSDRWEPGTATITLANPDGWADLGAPPIAPAELNVRPGRAIRWGVSVDGGPPVVMWRGVIEAQTATYDGRIADADTVTVTAIDALGDVGRQDLAGVAVPVGAGDFASTRIGRILDAAAHPPQLRAIAPSSVGMTATDLAGPVYDQLQVVADSTGGACYGDTAGRIVFRGRDWQTYVPGAPVDATIGNVPGAVCPVSWDVAFDRADITTRSVVAPDGGAAIVTDDPTGILFYGIETGPARTDLATTDTAVLTALGAWLLKSRGRLTMPRIRAVTLDAGTDPAVPALLASADPTRPSRWRCRLERAGRVVFDRELFVTAVRHSWDAGAWHATVTLDDAAPWAAAGGRWDGAVWDGATWAAAPLELDPADAAELAALVDEARTLIGARP